MHLPLFDPTHAQTGSDRERFGALAARKRIVYLSGAVRPACLGQQFDLGVLRTPEMGNKINLEGVIWAADNGLYAGPGQPPRTFRFDRFERLFTSIDAHHLDGCLFAAVPDMPYDADETLRRFEQWYPAFSELGDATTRIPLALVAQNGMEFMLDALPWDQFQVLFLGGDDQWKDGSAGAGRLVAEAKRRGKWVHCGRVNTWTRFKIAHQFGCDSMDGTTLKYGPDINTPILQRWLKRLNPEPTRALAYAPLGAANPSPMRLVVAHTVAERAYACDRAPGNRFAWRGERRCLHCAWRLIPVEWSSDA